MAKLPVIAVFDIGKSNKKILCFDQDYQVVLEKSTRLEQDLDEDGYPCEDLGLLKSFVLEGLNDLFNNKGLDIQAVNFSAYGASLVGVDREGLPVIPLYNYLKPLPPGLQEQFYSEYGGQEALALKTASPPLGSLNAGLQLYRLKQKDPERFARISTVFHLPHYLSWLVTGIPFTGYTSLGCHTLLWDFIRRDYADWVDKEGLMDKFPPLISERRSMMTHFRGRSLVAGLGIHDSSAALIPYLDSLPEPFILLSTGTWAVSLNPFNHDPLTPGELNQDCLCYLTPEGRPVKASRLFLGRLHEEGMLRISDQFQVDPEIISMYEGEAFHPEIETENWEKASEKNDFSGFDNPQMAYHALVENLVQLQKKAIRLVLGSSPPRQLFVDGGFSRNILFMRELQKSLPDMGVHAASGGQASALGAARAIHSGWNHRSFPNPLIKF